MIRYSARTDVGKRRQHNEDAMLADPDVGLFVVADGVGGRAAGEVASALTVSTFKECSKELQAAVQAYAAKPEWSTRNQVLDQLNEVCQRASRRVFDEAEARGQKGMTTTLVAALVGGGAVFLAHAGDSRAYLLRDGVMRQLTEDHSMVNELVRIGQMTPEEARKSSYRHVITRAIGLYPTVQADLMSIEVLPGDRLLLGSDGLSDPVPKKNIQKIASEGDTEAVVNGLIEAALERGAPDNVTVLAVDPEASPQYEAARARAQVMEELFLFRDLPFHARLRVSTICEELFFTPGQTLVGEGTAGDSMYVIVQGEVGVSHNSFELACLGPGEHFGEMSLVDQLPRSATVTGISFGSAIVIRREHLQEFCRREPELGNQIIWKLLATLGSRLREANVRATSRQTPPVD